MWRRQKGKEAVSSSGEGRTALAELRSRIARNTQAQMWGMVDTDVMAALQLLRDSSVVSPVPQSTLVELHGHLGLSLNAQRRYEEAYKHLRLARQLLYMEPEAAAAWAAGERLTLQEDGPPVEPALALEVLSALAESAVRLGQTGTGEVLRNVVEMADKVGDDAVQWSARQRLAAFTAGTADWQGLSEQGQQMGLLARQRRSLPRLLDALRHIVEASLGMQLVDQALEAQQLVVEVVRFLDDPSLPEEEKELVKIRTLRT